MPISIEPAGASAPETPVTPDALLYRGLSDPNEYERTRLRGFSPRSPVDAPADWLAAFASAETLDHVMQIKRDHFVSFTFLRKAACFYATSGYEENGWIAEVRLPPKLKGLVAGHVRPGSYVGNDRTAWVDPRFIVPSSAELVEGFDLWTTMRSRARGDDELLLARGIVRAVAIEPVRPDDCDRSFRPWSDWGE